MHRDNDRYKAFSRRAVLLLGGNVILLSGLIGRMYQLQVMEGERYKTLAEDNRINLKLLAPPRGRILDRFGRPMAVNRQNYRALLVPANILNVNTTIAALSQILNVSAKEKKRIAREVKRRKRFSNIVIRENLSWRQVSQIEANALELSGVMIDVGESRYYPDGEASASIIGYVGMVSEQEMVRDPLLRLPGFRVGKAGMEKVHDVALRGKGGTSQVEVNAFGREIRELSRIEGQHGSEAWLTIDNELQKLAANRLGEKPASAVVMDVHTGEVLALVSTPSFDPNIFNKGLSQVEWKQLISNPHSPLTNKAIAGQYAPGSVFKMIVALAALEKGVISKNFRVFCNGEIELGETLFHCWRPKGHGHMDLFNAIAQSCDVFFYEIALRTGINRIAAMARRLGLGQKFKIELPGEKAGLIPTRAWKRNVKGSKWQKGETLLAGIGQGFILATPLQMAVMISRLVNGGRLVVPSMTRTVVPFAGKPAEFTTPPSFKNMGVHVSHLGLVKKAMGAVTNSPFGTAYKARIKEPEFFMGGKTGTVQVRRISEAERESGVLKNKELAWHERDHALFVGYAPLEIPRYAISVIVEHGGSGASTAAPVARDILLEFQKRDPNSGSGAMPVRREVRLEPEIQARQSLRKV